MLGEPRVIARDEIVARRSRSKPGASSLCSEQAPQSQFLGLPRRYRSSQSDCVTIEVR